MILIIIIFQDFLIPPLITSRLTISEFILRELLNIKETNPGTRAGAGYYD